MPRTRSAARRAVALAAITPIVASCATLRPATEEERRVGGASTQVITREQIVESNARTIWDALLATVKHVHWGVGQAGTPQRGTRRGTTSGMGPEQVRVLLDGSDIQDLGQLRLMPAADVAEIVVLSGVDATTYLGTNSVAGAVLISPRR